MLTYHCTESPSIGQDFKQVYFDDKNNDQHNFALCLSKYFNGPNDATNWAPKYWCLIGKYQQVKILRAKTIDEIRGDSK